MGASEHTSERSVQRLLLCAAAFVLAAILISLTGGFALSLGALRLSVRGVRNPLLLAAVCGGAAWAIAPRGQRWRALVDGWSRVVAPVEAAARVVSPGAWQRSADLSAAAMAVAVIVVGVTTGSMVAGGSDSYGYVSQAHLWATGDLRIETPMQGELPEGVPYEAFAPLGYRLAPDGRSIVPTYAPGFPMVMAVFELVGGPNAVFYVMPLLAGLTVWLTYRLGTTLGGRAAGVLAAALLATSPPFLNQVSHAPMSDIAASAWWTLALLLAPRSSRVSALITGLAVGLAILTRPNLVPLAIVPGGLLLWNVMIHRSSRALATARLVLFAIGPVGSALTVAYLNDYWYGSPTASGYGALVGELFRWSFIWPNATSYSRSLLETQSVAVVLAAAGPFMVARDEGSADAHTSLRAVAVTCASFVAATYLCYAAYLPIDVWWTLRLILPAYPALFVVMSVAVLRLAALLPLRPRAIAPVMLAVLVLLHPLAFVRRANVLDSVGEKRFAVIGRYLADTLPPRAAIISVLHSGSATYYSGRLTLRYDMIVPGQLETVIRGLRQRGYAPFILLDLFEREEFGQKFGDPVRFGARDATAAALVPTVDLYRVN